MRHRNPNNINLPAANPVHKAPGHHMLMPPQEYRARNYNIIPYVGPVPQVLPGPLNQTPRSKKRKGKFKYVPSKRQARRIPTEGEGTGSKKRRPPAGVVDSLLSQKFGVVTLNCGTVAAQLWHGIRANCNLPNVVAPDGQGPPSKDELKKAVSNTLKDM
ncbi:hypothetical protein BGZ76_006924, partial [Entomortierella beljakovae]